MKMLPVITVAAAAAITGLSLVFHNVSGETGGGAVSDVEFVLGNFVSVPNNTTKSATATAACPAGKNVIGGSGQVNPTSGATDRFDKVNLAAGIPVNPGAHETAVTDGSATVWAVKGSGSSTGSGYQFRAIAVCADTDGTVGSGETPRVEATPLAPGVDCAAGGHKMDVGMDSGNGALESTEVEQTAFVCNGVDGIDGVDGADGSDGANGEDGANGTKGADGANGADGADGADGVDGFTSLVVTTQLESGDANCPAGGQRLESGLDDGLDVSDQPTGEGHARNDTLEAGEVEQITFVCNGIDGINGTNGIDGTNGTNGIDGFNSLLKVTLLGVTDVNCPNGGSTLQTGLDDGLDAGGAATGAARNGVLDAGEVDSTTHACASGDRALISGFGRKDIDKNLNQQMHRNAGDEHLAVMPVVMDRSGSVVGISVACTQPLSNGTGTFTVFKNGSTTGFAVSLSGSGAQYNSATQPAGADGFAANERLDVRVTTNSTWNPTGNDCEAVVTVQYH